MAEDKTDDDEMMWWFGKRVKVKDVERESKTRMEIHDALPRQVREAVYEGRRPGDAPKEVYVRARSVADKYIQADGSEPVVTDDEDIAALELKERAALEKAEAANKEWREINKRYRRAVAKVRYPLLNGWARRCLGHVECCDLRATQVEWLRELERRTVEVQDRDFEYRQFFERDFQIGEMSRSEKDRIFRIWLKIKALHEIEDAAAGIEWEIEQEAAKIEEREARDREWRVRMAPLPGGWRTPHLVEFEPAVAAAVMARIKEPIIRRR
jgi:hypothetical protein